MPAKKPRKRAPRKKSPPGVVAGLEVTLAELDALSRLDGRTAEVALLRQLAQQIESAETANAMLVKQYREGLEALHVVGEDSEATFASIVAGIDANAKARGRPT